MGLWLWLLLASLGAAPTSAAGDGLFPPRDEALRIGETSRAFKGEVLRSTDGLRPLGEALRLMRIQLIKPKQIETKLLQDSNITQPFCIRRLGPFI